MIYLVYIGIGCVSIYFVALSVAAIGFVKGVSCVRDRNNSALTRSFSIVVAYRNEEDKILKLLESVAALEYPKESFELVLVNDHSTDNGPIQVKQFMQQHPDLTIRTEHLANDEGKKAALRYGVSVAQNDFIACSDADCSLPYSWLNDLNAAYDSNAAMLVSPVQFIVKPGLLNAFQQLDLFALQGAGLGGLAAGIPTLNNGANLSFHKKIFQEVGGFDTHSTPSGDDVFLLERFSRENKLIKANLSREAIVETELPSTWSDFFAQRIRWASKAKYYKSVGLIFLSMVVVLTNLFLLFFYSGAVLVEKYRTIFVFLALSKWLIDFILLFLVASFYEQKEKLWYFIPVQLMYPFYVLSVWVASMTSSYKWKGRTYNG